MAEKTEFEKCNFRNFRGPWSWPWRWIESYGIPAYRRASIVDLYVHTKFHWNRKKLFWWRTNHRDPSKFKVMWHKN